MARRRHGSFGLIPAWGHGCAVVLAAELGVQIPTDPGAQLSPRRPPVAVRPQSPTVSLRAGVSVGRVGLCRSRYRGTQSLSDTDSVTRRHRAAACQWYSEVSVPVRPT